MQTKLPPGANRILFVKNLNYQITGEDLYDLFGRYGSIRQIRIGNEQKTKGTAFVVYDDVMEVRSSLSIYPNLHIQSLQSRPRTPSTIWMVFTYRSDILSFFTICPLNKMLQLQKPTLPGEKRSSLNLKRSTTSQISSSHERTVVCPLDSSWSDLA